MADRVVLSPALKRPPLYLLSLGVESSSRVLQYLGEAEMERLAANDQREWICNQRCSPGGIGRSLCPWDLRG